MDLSPIAESTSTLLYKNLPVKPWQTRLLKLHSNGTADCVSGDLIVADITFLNGAVLHQSQQHVEYNALSYTWGDGPYSRDITLNGSVTLVKESLFGFLRRYAGKNGGSEMARFIWIDALCINQADDDEKSQQVSSMLAFYEHADEVIVWLGEEIQQTEAAMDYIGQDHRRRSNQKNTTSLQKDADLLFGLRDLYNRPWATRIWIKQEVWAGKSITVQCGRHIVPWEDFINTFGKVRGHPGIYKEDDGVGSQSHNENDGMWLEKYIGSDQVRAWSRLPRPTKEEIRLKRQDAVEHRGKKQDILYLLQDARYCESTDIRDRIFALLGMCNDPNVKVDYNLTASQVFTSLARHLIERETRMAVILALNCSFGSCEGLKLPSWAPDWRTLDSTSIGLVWKVAFDPKRHEVWKKRLEMESIIALPPKARGPKTLAWRRHHRAFYPKNFSTLYLRGFTIAKFPKEAETSDLEDWRICWNPLAPFATTAAATELEDYREIWQKNVKRRALDIINDTTSSVVSDDRTPEDRRRVIQLLGFPSEAYIPTHFKDKTATFDDLRGLGDVAFQLSSDGRDISLKEGDLLVACHGCNLPVILRPTAKGERGRFTFVGVMQCHEIDRLSHRDASYPDSESGVARIDEEFKIMLHANEGLGGIETYAVI